MRCHAFLQWIFLTQGLNPRLLVSCTGRQVLLPLAPLGKPTTHPNCHNSWTGDTLLILFLLFSSSLITLCGFWDVCGQESGLNKRECGEGCLSPVCILVHCGLWIRKWCHRQVYFSLVLSETPTGGANRNLNYLSMTVGKYLLWELLPFYAWFIYSLLFRAAEENWRRKWQPTPVFFPGESQGWGSLVGCHLWGHTESDTTEAT